MANSSPVKYASRQIDTSCAIQRESSPYLDSILGHAFPVLDHGYIRVVSYMGVDASVAQGARVSYGKGTKTVNEDEGLIRRLLKDNHMSPFELCSIEFHVKLPIFVARQWVRHRTAHLNEYSGRYSVMDNDFYVPTLEHILPQSIANKQGRAGDMPIDQKIMIQDSIRKHSLDSYALYEKLLTPANHLYLNGGLSEDEFIGLSREIARTVLPVNFYTQWYWKIDLRNLLHFISLRSDPHAQYEIRAYSDIMAQIVSQWVPSVYKAFTDYRQNAVTFSQDEFNAIKKAVSPISLIDESFSLAKKDKEHLFKQFGV